MEGSRLSLLRRLSGLLSLFHLVWRGVGVGWSPLARWPGPYRTWEDTGQRAYSELGWGASRRIRPSASHQPNAGRSQNSNCRLVYES